MSFLFITAPPQLMATQQDQCGDKLDIIWSLMELGFPAYLPFLPKANRSKNGIVIMMGIPYDVGIFLK
jgi:hypothetical protein